MGIIELFLLGGRVVDGCFCGERMQRTGLGQN